MKTGTSDTVKIKNARLMRQLKNQTPLCLMALPVFILTIMFSYIPMFGLILAFKNFNVRDGIFDSPWIGFKNFSYLFKTNDAAIMLRNTLGYNLMFILINVLFGVAMAVAITMIRSKRASKTYQTVMIMPHFLSMVIVAYLALAFLNMENGLINSFIKAMGGKGVNWYVEPKWWPVILTIVNVWKETGFGSIIYISTIAGIDTTLYEAADIDGANSWQKIKSITLPMLKTIICIQIILGIGKIFAGDFGLFYQVPMNSGALKETTLTIPVYIYKNMTSGGPRTLGLSSATAFIQSVAGCVLVFATNCIVRKIDEESSLF